MATATQTSAAEARPEPSHERAFLRRLTAPGNGGLRLSWPAALAAALASGGCLLAAFPPFGVWPLAPVGVALMGAVCHRRSLRGGFGQGVVVGVAFFFPLLSWTSIQVGEVPWILLSLLQAVYFGLMGAAAAGVSRLVDKRPALWPAALALLWVGQEALRSRTPFGGFPWGRLAFSQADSPLGRLAWLGGTALVTFAVALAGGLLLLAAWRMLAGGRVRRAMLLPALAALATGAVGLAVPVSTTAPDGEETTMAVVQGNVPRIGLDFNAQRRAVLENHVLGTLELAETVDAETAQQLAAAFGPQREAEVEAALEKSLDEAAPQVVVWPENASDINPLSNEDAAELIDLAAQAVDAPIVVGTLLHDVSPDSDREAKNVSLVWSPQSGPGFQYVKQHPVPFAEYIPMEPFVRTVAGWIDPRIVEDGLDRVNGFEAGTQPGVIPVDDMTLSGVICFEVAYDGLVRESVTEGAQVLAVQTNNATFNNAEAVQQLAMVQIRSIEHARPGLMASTVGVSGFVDETGRVSQATGFNEADVIVSTFNLGEGGTPATTLGAAPELVGSAAALAVLILAATRRRRRSQTKARGASR